MEDILVLIFYFEFHSNLLYLEKKVFIIFPRAGITCWPARFSGAKPLSGDEEIRQDLVGHSERNKLSLANIELNSIQKKLLKGFLLFPNTK